MRCSSTSALDEVSFQVGRFTRRERVLRCPQWDRTRSKLSGLLGYLLGPKDGSRMPR